MPVVTMAGFVTRSNQWKELEPKLDAVMNAYGIPVFHAKEFHDTKPPFHGWTRIKKRSFADELFAITGSVLYGLSMTIRKADFVKAQAETGLYPNMSAIGVCFSTIMTRIVANPDPQFAAAIKEDGISFLVESGNRNNSEIESFFYQMAQQETFEGALRSISFISKRRCRAIQLADFYAFYSRRYMRNHDRFSGKLALPAFPFIETMKRHCHIWLRGGFGRSQPTSVNLDNLPDLSALRDLAKKPTS